MRSRFGDIIRQRVNIYLVSPLHPGRRTSSYNWKTKSKLSASNSSPSSGLKTPSHCLISICHIYIYIYIYIYMYVCVCVCVWSATTTVSGSCKTIEGFSSVLLQFFLTYSNDHWKLVSYQKTGQTLRSFKFLRKASPMTKPTIARYIWLLSRKSYWSTSSTSLMDHLDWRGLLSNLQHG